MIKYMKRVSLDETPKCAGQPVHIGYHKRRKNMKKRTLALVLSSAMVLSLAACGGGGGTQQTTSAATTAAATTAAATTAAATTAAASETTAAAAETTTAAAAETTAAPEVPAEPVVIRYGTHWINELDPSHTDDVTGEYTMQEENRQAALAALAAVKETYNVDIEFLQYPNDVSTDLMTSVLAGDPIVDLALLWGGVEPTILSQNVLQDLSDYTYLFEDPESSWMLKDSLFGGYYLLNNEVPLVTNFPLVVNLTMLEEIPGLKDESGKTIYPMDLFLNGEWTWSKFKEYLTTVQAYYANVTAPDGGVYEFVQAYETDHRYAALAAIHANGGGIFDGGVTADSDECIEAVQYVKELMDDGILTDCGLYDDGFTPEWTRGSGDFGLGCTVFTDCANWLIGWESSQRADQGQSIGIIPWPRPDDMPFDSEDYMQSTNGGNSVAVLKGVSPEKTELALKSYILYWQTYYYTLGGVNTIDEYREASAQKLLRDYGIDFFNENYGDSLMECFTYILGHMNMNYANLMSLWDGNWEAILGKSYYGLEGYASYDVSIKQHLTDLTNVTENIAAILKTDEIHDNQAPNVTTEDPILAAGTDAASVDWTQYFTAEDSVDGAIAITADAITVSEELDLSVPGAYDKAVTVKVADTSGNERESSVKVIVYNADNTAAPTVEAAAELPTVALNTETSGIDWSSFLASATDADGLDVKSKVTADLSTLDTTTPGTYSVTLTVTDYAGNTAEITVDVTVVSE